MSQEGAFAVKLSQLEYQCGQTLNRLRLYQERDHRKIREELKQVLGAYQENEHLLQKAVNTGRSPTVAALSEAQLSYDRRVRRILQDELPGCLHRGDSSFSADQVEAISLYGEYAIDFAAQAMRYAHLVVLSAIDAQISLEEQKQEDSI